MLDGTESLPLLVHSVCQSAQTEERQKNRSLLRIYCPWVDRCRSAVTQLQQFLPSSRSEPALIAAKGSRILSSLTACIVLWKTSRETSFVPNGSGTNAGLFLSETYI